VTSSALLDKEVLIEEMILPEFSSTTQISGPIHAIIMDNGESSYDLIIGMDLLQTLGIVFLMHAGLKSNKTHRYSAHPIGNFPGLIHPLCPIIQLACQQSKDFLPFYFQHDRKEDGSDCQFT
jgi:hypothetical protein